MEEAASVLKKIGTYQDCFCGKSQTKFILATVAEDWGDGIEPVSAHPMEPFNLTLSSVNSADNDSFDSFNNVVNYETNFGPSDQSLPLSSYNINTVEYTWTGNIISEFLSS